MSLCLSGVGRKGVALQLASGTETTNSEIPYLVFVFEIALVDI